MKEKNVYASPEVDVVELQPEGVVCTSGEFDPSNWNPGSSDWWNDPNF